MRPRARQCGSSPRTLRGRPTAPPRRTGSHQQPSGAATRPRWNELEHVDSAHLEYRDPNDAGASPAHGPALVFATSRDDGNGPHTRPHRWQVGSRARLAPSQRRDRRHTRVMRITQPRGGRGYLKAGFCSARSCTSSGRPWAHYWCGRISEQCGIDPVRTAARVPRVRPLHQRARCHTIRAGAYASPGSATGWPVIPTVSLAQAKQLCHVDEFGGDRESSVSAASRRLLELAQLLASRQPAVRTRGPRVDRSSHRQGPESMARPGSCEPRRRSLLPPMGRRLRATLPVAVFDTSRLRPQRTVRARGARGL